MTFFEVLVTVPALGPPVCCNFPVTGKLLLLLKCCFTSTETVGLLGTGAQDVHLDFHAAPELCRHWQNQLTDFILLALASYIVTGEANLPSLFC